MKNTNEKIEIGIDTINRKAMALKKDNWPRFSDQLRDLRRYMHDLEYWLDSEIRTQIETEAEQKAQAIINAGFTFDSVVIDKVELTVYNGKAEKKCQDDSIPF